MMENWIPVTEEQWIAFELNAEEKGWEKWISACGTCANWMVGGWLSRHVAQEQYKNENSDEITLRLVAEDLLDMCKI